MGLHQHLSWQFMEVFYSNPHHETQCKDLPYSGKYPNHETQKHGISGIVNDALIGAGENEFLCLPPDICIFAAATITVMAILMARKMMTRNISIFLEL
ncbi:hypothetical protein BDR03DRAFT_948009 [Suillus americanus]|nr:hypothetical protein BDR03DRAFT_948009 [Suillus americanus]